MENYEKIDFNFYPFLDEYQVNSLYSFPINNREKYFKINNQFQLNTAKLFIDSNEAIKLVKRNSRCIIIGSNNTNYIEDFIKTNNPVLIDILEKYDVESLSQKNTLYDYIYLNSSTTRDFDKELEWASKNCDQGGIIGINRYMMTDPHMHLNIWVHDYTNNFINSNFNWKVIGLALNKDMLFDIYLQKDFI